MKKTTCWVSDDGVQHISEIEAARHELARALMNHNGSLSDPSSLKKLADKAFQFYHVYEQYRSQ